MRIPSLVGLFCLFSGLLFHAQGLAQSAPSAKTSLGLRPPVLTRDRAADFPVEALRNNQTGLCVISLIVDEKGQPREPKVIRCSDSIFEENSLAAVMQYRFKPAVRLSDGSAVATKITIDISFGTPGIPAPWKEPPTEVRYGFFSPPGTSSPDPDGDGFYPLTKVLTGPQIRKFVSRQFGVAAMRYPAGVGCHVLLSLDAEGKPVNAKVTDCDVSSLSKPAMESLLASKYRPAKLNGKAVPVRMLVYIAYAGFGPHEAK